MQYVVQFCYVLFFACLCLLLTPVLISIVLIICIFDGLPIFYRQKRTGINSKAFVFYKFRTMKVGADEWQKQYKHLNEADGPVFKIHNDPRFTTIGKFLSHTGLDELPQLINVIKGDMVIIGPRALPEKEAKKLKSWQKKRHIVKPGIISPWVLEGYHKQSFNNWMRSDIAYAQNKNTLLDIRLFVGAVILFGELLIRELLRVFRLQKES